MAELDGRQGIDGREGIDGRQRMDVAGFDGTGAHAGTAVRRRPRPDLLTLLVGLLSLAVAVAAFVGWVPDLSGFDARWLLAGGATAVGVLLLVGSRRGHRSS